jgi:hypothetical protein
MKAAGFPPLSRLSPAASLPPFALGLALDPSGLGHVATFTRRLRDPPVSERRHYGLFSLVPLISETQNYTRDQFIHNILLISPH